MAGEMRFPTQGLSCALQPGLVLSDLSLSHNLALQYVVLTGWPSSGRQDDSTSPVARHLLHCIVTFVTLDHLLLQVSMYFMRMNLDKLCSSFLFYYRCAGITSEG